MRSILSGTIATMVLLLAALNTSAQDDMTVADTLERTQQLMEVQVTAYGAERKLLDVPAGIATINNRELDRYGTASLVPAMNSIPGVRMEERSPGSYRLSIRGSSLRSPFGVRNVKLYYNNIPVSDPGGFSYLNQFGFSNVQDIQIIKGPGSSVYGAGNGGVVLVNSFDRQASTGIRAGISAGSYGLRTALAELKVMDNRGGSAVRYEHVESNGYRRQSGLTRNCFSWDGMLSADTGRVLTAHFLYTHLFYQTPGGLNWNEFNADPRSARPDVGTVPGAERSKAAIYQNNVLTGLNYKRQYSRHLQNTTSLYVSFSEVNNPNTRNYSRTTDPHFGGRTSFQLEQTVCRHLLNIQVGGEVQKAIATIRTYRNNQGQTDTLIADEDIQSLGGLAFAQATLQARRWVLEAGLGFSRLEVDYNSRSAFYSASVGFGQVSPRIAALYKWNRSSSIYLNVARGFSPPTTAELVPSGSASNLGLQPEHGWNYELGTRGYAIDNRLSYDASVFYFQLANAIVVRRDSAGGDRYVNAGGTRQLGVETKIDYTVGVDAGVVRNWRIWSSLTAYRFRYHQFQQLNDDHSGKELPGVPAYTIAAGIDIAMKPGLVLHITYLYNDRIALNDANSVYADPFHLPGMKLSYRLQRNKYSLEFFAGADNLLDERYSLGNDINAAGGRYYNAAPGRNLYAGLVLSLNK